MGVSSTTGSGSSSVALFCAGCIPCCCPCVGLDALRVLSTICRGVPCPWSPISITLYAEPFRTCASTSFAGPGPYSPKTRSSAPIPSSVAPVRLDTSVKISLRLAFFALICKPWLSHCTTAGVAAAFAGQAGSGVGAAAGTGAGTGAATGAPALAGTGADGTACASSRAAAKAASTASSVAVRATDCLPISFRILTRSPAQPFMRLCTRLAVIP